MNGFNQIKIRELPAWVAVLKEDETVTRVSTSKP